MTDGGDTTHQPLTFFVRAPGFWYAILRHRCPDEIMGNRGAKSGKSVQTRHIKKSASPIAFTAARWWRKLLEGSEPQIKTGMSLFAQNFVADQHRRMKSQVTPDQAEAFEKDLQALLERQLAARDRGGVTLHVDYDPGEPLATVMRDNGIPPRIFPPHTWMQVERGRIQIKMNDTDAIDLLCSQPE